jgi:hypothetical protein
MMSDKLGIARVPSVSRNIVANGVEQRIRNHAEENLIDADLGITKIETWKRMPCVVDEHNCEQQLRNLGIELDR